jgi:hypothetical protein
MSDEEDLSCSSGDHSSGSLSGGESDEPSQNLAVSTDGLEPNIEWTRSKRFMG